MFTAVVRYLSREVRYIFKVVVTLEQEDEKQVDSRLT